jgi:hypothetical protein
MISLYYKTPVKLLLKIGAFLFPLFFIYGPFNDEQNNALSQQVWKYIMAGLVFELILLFTFLFYSMS